MISRICAALWVLFVLAGVCLAKDPPVVSDAAIADNVMIKLSGDPVVKGGALKVDVKDGVVTLSGPVEQEKQKEKAGKIARKVKGVKQVVNNIVIQTRTSAR